MVQVKLQVCDCAAIIQVQLAEFIFLDAALKTAYRKVSSDFLDLVSISSYLTYSMAAIDLDKPIIVNY